MQLPFKDYLVRFKGYNLSFLQHPRRIFFTLSSRKGAAESRDFEGNLAGEVKPLTAGFSSAAHLSGLSFNECAAFIYPRSPPVRREVKKQKV